MELINLVKEIHLEDGKLWPQTQANTAWSALASKASRRKTSIWAEMVLWPGWGAFLREEGWITSTGNLHHRDGHQLTRHGTNLVFTHLQLWSCYLIFIEEVELCLLMPGHIRLDGFLSGEEDGMDDSVFWNFLFRIVWTGMLRSEHKYWKTKIIFSKWACLQWIP
jgi:hypothetical protein